MHNIHSRTIERMAAVFIHENQGIGQKGRATPSAANLGVPAWDVRAVKAS
jgi:hypothetical protein